MDKNNQQGQSMTPSANALAGVQNLSRCSNRLLFAPFTSVHENDYVRTMTTIGGLREASYGGNDKRRGA